jgi:three-Cys-motif partner protein
MFQLAEHCMANKFGGPWTQQKQDCVREYLDRWVEVFKNMDWCRTFAGSGHVVRAVNSSEKDPFADDYLEEEAEAVFKGSALSALEVEPPFDVIDLIEKNSRAMSELQDATKVEDQRKINFYQEDANSALREICRKFESKDRAVLFLDPYGCSVDWETLKVVAATQAIDVWYLFPTSGINRMLAGNREAIDESWVSRLNRCLGTDEWQTAFYRKSDDPDLFGDFDLERHAGLERVEDYFIERLAEIFADVAPKAVRLRNSRGTHIFSLCFAIANPSPAAKRAALGIANSLIKKWEHPNGR